MVCEKNQNTVHDFLTDGIRFMRAPGDDWLKADGTTLGADNGIGECTPFGMTALVSATSLM